MVRKWSTYKDKAVDGSEWKIVTKIRGHEIKITFTDTLYCTDFVYLVIQILVLVVGESVALSSDAAVAGVAESCRDPGVRPGG